MQKRHQDRLRYFNELANTSKEYYLDYLRPYVKITASTRVLEIGCGEGGNLLPFAQAGCQVTGIDISSQRIEQARQYFKTYKARGTFLCCDFLKTEQPQNEDGRYDVILMHDVIEHIEPPFKGEFIGRIRPFLRKDGLVFVGFPAWQMPFGGHQQISRGLVSKLPYVHLLPNPVYKMLIKISGNGTNRVQELMSIKRAKMTIENFEQLANDTGYHIARRTLWLINPHYKQKFHLKPRILWPWAARLKYLRNYYTTSAFYLLKQELWRRKT